MTYEVDGHGFNSFLQAIKAAKASGSTVVETATGNVRWRPAPPVSEKRMREYRDRLNARAAYERMISGDC